MRYSSGRLGLVDRLRAGHGQSDPIGEPVAPKFMTPARTKREEHALLAAESSAQQDHDAGEDAREGARS